MQTSTAICFPRDCCHAPAAAMHQLHQPLLDATLPTGRCLVFLTATMIALLILIQVTSA
jgi:hypothetical protein